MLPIIEFDDIRQAIDTQEVDFVLTNPADYIDLEENHGATRIATLVNRREKNSTNEYGAVIFTRSDNKEIKKISDIKGHPQTTKRPLVV